MEDTASVTPTQSRLQIVGASWLHNLIVGELLRSATRAPRAALLSRAASMVRITDNPSCKLHVISVRPLINKNSSDKSSNMSLRSLV